VIDPRAMHYDRDNQTIVETASATARGGRQEDV
jgi:hypothetical protein